MHVAVIGHAVSCVFGHAIRFAAGAGPQRSDMWSGMWLDIRLDMQLGVWRGMWLGTQLRHNCVGHNYIANLGAASMFT